MSIKELYIGYSTFKISFLMKVEFELQFLIEKLNSKGNDRRCCQPQSASQHKATKTLTIQELGN